MDAPFEASRHIVDATSRSIRFATAAFRICIFKLPFRF
jgi:hypothetical protein